MIDPRMFLGIGGPIGPQPLTSGFRAPGPGPGAPMMAPPQMPPIGIPGMGMGMRPPSGGTFGNQSGDALKQTAAGTSVAETMNPFSTDPTGLAGGGISEAGAVAPGGSFMNWFRGLW